MSRYRNGRDFEYRTRDHFRDDGYDVIRSAGSKTKVDLVAIKPGQLLFVQCKRDGRCSPAERHTLIRLAWSVGAIPVLAHLGPRVGNQAAPFLLRQLTGPGPRDWEPFTTDEVIP